MMLLMLLLQLRMGICRPTGGFAPNVVSVGNVSYDIGKFGTIDFGNGKGDFCAVFANPFIGEIHSAVEIYFLAAFTFSF